MKKQKIIKVGNSLAVTLPAEFVKEGNIAVGDELLVEHNSRYKTIYMKPVNDKRGSSLTPDFFEWLDEISNKYKDAIKELANT